MCPANGISGDSTQVDRASLGNPLGPPTAKTHRDWHLWAMTISVEFSTHLSSTFFPGNYGRCSGHTLSQNLATCL